MTNEIDCCFVPGVLVEEVFEITARLVVETVEALVLEMLSVKILGYVDAEENAEDVEEGAEKCAEDTDDDGDTEREEDDEGGTCGWESGTMVVDGTVFSVGIRDILGETPNFMTILLLAASCPRSMLTVPGAEVMLGGVSFIWTVSFPMLMTEAMGDCGSDILTDFKDSFGLALLVNGRRELEVDIGES